MQMVFEVGAFSAAAIMVGWLGVKQLAAHQVALSMAATTYMMATGISAAATVRVSNFLGSGDRHQLQVAGYSSMLMVIAFMGSTATIFVLCKSFLPYLFIHDEEVVGIASSLLIIAAFFQVSDGVQAVGLGCLRGLSDVKIPTMITLLAYWVIGLPVGYLIGNRLGWGVYGIWTGLSIGLTTAAIMLFFRFRYLSRQGKILELQQRAK
jgi:MATE family multidrug resistance protein